MMSLPDTEQQFAEVWNRLNNLQRRWVLARLSVRFDREASVQVGCHEKTPIKWRQTGIPIDKAIELLTLDSIKSVQLALNDSVMDAVAVIKRAMTIPDANGIRAAIEVLDRVVGKPAQNVNMDADITTGGVLLVLDGKTSN